MSELTIRAPHPGMSVEELAQTWDDLLRIAHTYGDALLGEVLHAMLPDTPMPNIKPSPYPESSEHHRIWCAMQFAMSIGEYSSAMKLANELGRSKVMRERVVRRRKPE
jgi:hypothetical protein